MNGLIGKALRFVVLYIVVFQLVVPAYAMPVAGAGDGANIIGVDVSNGINLLYDTDAVSKDVLSRDIRFFLAGIAFPIEDMIVDLNIYNMPENVIDTSLMDTEVGRVFLDADVRLKRLVKSAFENEDVQEALEDASFDEDMPAFRVWIQPKSVDIIESKDKSSANIKNLYLGVKFEFNQIASEEILSVFDREIIPQLEDVVNNGSEFQDLRRVISAVILADWYKKRSLKSPVLNSLADTRYKKVAMASRFWSVRDYMDKYILGYYNAQEGAVGGVNPKPEEEKIKDGGKMEGKRRAVVPENVIRRIKELKRLAKGPERIAMLIKGNRSIYLLEGFIVGRLADARVGDKDKINELASELREALNKWVKVAEAKIVIKGYSVDNLVEESNVNGLLKVADYVGRSGVVGFIADVFSGVLEDYMDEPNDTKRRIILALLDDVKIASSHSSTCRFNPITRWEIMQAFLTSIDKEPVEIAYSEFKKDLVAASKNTRRILKDNVFTEIGYDNGRARMGWTKFPDEETVEQWAKPLIEKLEGKKHVIAVGMGGSINTVKLMKKLYGLDNLIALDTPDKAIIESILDEKGVDLKDTAVVLISKSGTTYETHAIADILKAMAEEKGASVGNNFIWMVDSGNEDKVGDESIKKISLQPDGRTDIGGRYSSPATGVALMPLLWKHLRGVAKEKGKPVFLEEIRRIKAAWEGIMGRDESDAHLRGLNEKAYQDALNLYIMNKLFRYGPRVAIKLPDDLEKRAYEEIRIWITQLWQESIGGKDKNITPKIEVIAQNTSEDRIELLREDGFYFIEPEARNIFELQGYMYVLTSAFSAMAQIPFLGQGNVQLYKNNMAQLKGQKIGRPMERMIEEVLLEIEGKIKNRPFMDVVLYGNYSDEDKARLKKAIEEKFPDKIAFIFDGPDYNHHSFEALATDPYTLPVLLVHPDAGQDILKVAKATQMAFEEEGKDVLYATGGTKPFGNFSVEDVIERVGNAFIDGGMDNMPSSKELSDMISKIKDIGVKDALEVELQLRKLLEDLKMGIGFEEDIVWIFFRNTSYWDIINPNVIEDLSSPRSKDKNLSLEEVLGKISALLRNVITREYDEDIAIDWMNELEEYISYLKKVVFAEIEGDYLTLSDLFTTMLIFARFENNVIASDKKMRDFLLFAAFTSYIADKTDRKASIYIREIGRSTIAIPGVRVNLPAGEGGNKAVPKIGTLRKDAKEKLNELAGRSGEEESSKPGKRPGGIWLEYNPGWVI